MENQSQELGELAKALAAAQSKFTFANKNATADMGGRGRRSYADLQSVLDAIRTPLAENGLAVVQLPTSTEKSVTVRTMLMHSSGQWIASEFSLPIDRMGGVQGLGSALTYARRYSLSAICGISQDDDDGELAQKSLREAEKERIRQDRQYATANNQNPPTPEHLKALWASMSAAGYNGSNREQALGVLSSILGRQVMSSKELTKDEVSAVIDALSVKEQQ